MSNSPPPPSEIRNAPRIFANDDYLFIPQLQGLSAAFTGLIWISITLLVPETYAPILLRRRAEKLSQITGKEYVSKLDAGKPKKTVRQEFKVALSRPWILLFREPIVALTSLYMAII